MRAFTAGAFALLVLLVVPAAANATTIDVNTTDDTWGGSPATCSLREAITAANTDSSYDGCSQGSGADEIRLPAGTYKITIAGTGEDNNATGDFDIRGSNALSIVPSTDDAAVKIDGNGLDRVFDQATMASFSIRNLWITGGDLAGQIADGGGILNTSGPLSVDGSTISGNHSEHEAGGIAVYSSMTMINSTVSGNRADGNGNGRGGGFADAAASSINFTNVINAGNEGKPAIPPGQATDCSAGPTFFPRYTLQTQPLGPLDCLVGFDPGTNQVVDDAKLGQLADNGGPTPTHALLVGSPAIGAGGTTAPDQCPATDQNGRARPADSCDIGAVQFFEPPQPPDEPLPGVKNPTDTIATFDGKRLHIRLKCPARFRPKCRSVAVPMTKKKRGKPMGKAKKVVTKSNKWKRITFLIKPAFRARVEKMTYVDAKRLVVRQKIRSKRVFRKRAKKPSTIFHVYKVRVKL